MSNHYNPDWLGDDALLAGFVARQSEFTHLHDVLARVPLVGSAQHYLLVGVRGAGKTTLLKRLAVAIRQEASLSDHLIALSFPEELYQVKNLSDFWWASCEALADELDRLGQGKEADQLLEEVDAVKYNPATPDAGFALLQRTCAQLQKRPVLLVDNLDFVFQRIDKSGRKLKDPHAAAYWTLREQLSTSTSPIVIGGSVRLSEPLTDYDKAFYDFFIPKRLGKLGLGEVKQVLVRLADAKGAPEVKTRLAERPSRLETLYDLTGGNPRAIGLVFQLLNQNPSSRAIDDFGQLMDITTPYYKARFEDLPEQAQVVMHALAVRRPTDAAGSGLRFGHTAAELAAHSGLVTSSVSAQLDNMDKEGLIEKSNAHGRVQYRIAEQLFRLWLQMRGNRRIRQNVMGLAEFLEAMFNADELMKGKIDTDAAAPLANARYAMALSGVSQTQHLRSSLEAQGMDGVMEHLDTEGGELRQYVGDGDVSADLQALTTLHEQLKKCKTHGLNADEQEALIGSVKLTLAKKQSFVAAICTPEAADKAMLEVREHLAREQRDLQRHGLLETDLKPFFHARLRACLPLPNFTPADATNTISYLGNTPAIRSMVWRVMGLRRMISIKDEAAAMEWLRWGEKNADAASATEWANVAGTMRLSDCLETAQATLDKAIAKGECARTWFEKAALLHRQNGSIKLVESYYQEAIKSDPTDAFVWNNLGNVLRTTKRLGEAENAYRKALELDPADVHVWNNLGNVLRDNKRLDEAENAYRKAIDRDPAYVYAWNGLGNVLRDNKRFDEAEIAYRKALELDPAYIYAWNNLGHVLRDNKRLDEAETAYGKALELDPAYVYAWNGLGNVLRDNKRLDEAETAYRKAIELDPAYALGWINLGRLLTSLDRIEEAVDSYQVASNLGTEWQDWVLSQLAMLRAQLFAQKAAQALANKDAAQIQSLLADLQKDVPDLSEAFATTHFVEGFLAIALKDQKQAVHILGLLRELNTERFARPLLLAFEAAVANRPEMLAELEPELQRAAQRMYERLTSAA